MDAEVDALRALPPPPPGPLRIVMSGRLLHWKGFDLGLRALAGVPARPSTSWASGRSGRG